MAAGRDAKCHATTFDDHDGRGNHVRTASMRLRIKVGNNAFSTRRKHTPPPHLTFLGASFKQYTGWDILAL